MATVLLVEDEAALALIIKDSLEVRGFTVLHAASAEAALELAVQQPLSLITLDIMLPNMDGWELLSRLKRMPELRRVPVVIISIVADRKALLVAFRNDTLNTFTIEGMAFCIRQRAGVLGAQMDVSKWNRLLGFRIEHLAPENDRLGSSLGSCGADGTKR